MIEPAPNLEADRALVTFRNVATLDTDCIDLLVDVDGQQTTLTAILQNAPLPAAAVSLRFSPAQLATLVAELSQAYILATDGGHA